MSCRVRTFIAINKNIRTPVEEALAIRPLFIDVNKKTNHIYEDEEIYLYLRMNY